ncbi:MAG: type I restriction endonuclease subunit R [Lautropia sp.]|nr:type I restriction endonuclease subunit R [Lautropia sp.]
MSFLSEAQVEAALLARLAELGYTCVSNELIAPDNPQATRSSQAEVVLLSRLQAAVARLNPGLPASVQQEAIRRVVDSPLPDLLEENRRVHALLTDGVDVEYHAPDGSLATGTVRMIDTENPENNDWLAINQFVVTRGAVNRRPDVVLFVNGLPLVVIELKAPASVSADLGSAFNQLQTYKQQIPALFATNALLLVSDGLTARVGSLSANQERFMPWRTTDGKTVAPKGAPELATLAEGVLQHRRLLDLLANFTVFRQSSAGLDKIIAGYHQYHAVRKAVEQTIRAMPTGAVSVHEDPAVYDLPSATQQPAGDRRAGVIWHTQGSGKSLLMAFYAGQLVRHPQLANPTLLVITDRNDLDDQLFATFSMCRDLIRQAPVQAQSREHLVQLLSRASGGVIFTTLQKFGDVEGALTLRSNVVVMADEAHRSQYGFKARVDTRTGEMAYGFAKYMRDALPYASFIGFTGTPIEADDVNTPAVFGNYIDIYDISRAVEDGATVPIYYESRLARIELDEATKASIDAEVDALVEDEDIGEQERFKQKWSTLEALVGSERRLAKVAIDLVTHFETRVAALDGKAMVACMSRRICVRLYDEIVRLRPDWHSDSDSEGAVKIVMTGTASDPPAWQQHVGNQARRDLLARRARDPKDPLKIVIVRDMWLTGFDAPCMHTMYVDKPMKGHGLMQAIARVNRVFRDKPAGLVVDYIGIAQNLKTALQQYSASSREQTGIDEREAVAVMLEKYEVVRAMFHGFDYTTAMTGTPTERLTMMAGAVEWILAQQQQASAGEKTEEGKRKTHRRYQDAVLALSTAYALAATSDEAQTIRDEVGFFQAIRTALIKSRSSSGLSTRQRDLAIQQIVSRAVVSTDIVDILGAAGIQSPDISILSDEFLAELKDLNAKNLALEALRKLLNDKIRSRSLSHVVQSRAFSERLEASIARYHANAITTAEVLQYLIDLAREIRDAHAQGEASGLSPEELAFYQALAANESAVQAMGDAKLRLIAHELLTSLRDNVTVDWAQRASAQARIRILVKRILRKYGYPPDLQDSAVQTVLKQAEALSTLWTQTDA